MGYAVSDSVVRADRFKPSGKWYETIALKMDGFYITVPKCHSAMIFCGCMTVCSQTQEFYSDTELALRGFKRRKDNGK